MMEFWPLSASEWNWPNRNWGETTVQLPGFCDWLLFALSRPRETLAGPLLATGPSQVDESGGNYVFVNNVDAKLDLVHE